MPLLPLRLDLRVALLYALFGGLWVLLTDHLLAASVRDGALLTKLQTSKGWFFVLLSTLLIFWLLRQNLQRSGIAEAQLRESEERYRQLFENSLDAILLAAPDGRIFDANPAACRLFAQTEEELRQAGQGGIIDSADPQSQAALAERARTGRFRGELTFVRGGGARFPGELTTASFQTRDGQNRMSMIIRDITERRRAEAQIRAAEATLRLQSTALEAAANGIVITDRDGTIQWVNSAFTALTGYTAAEAAGLNPRDLVRSGAHAAPFYAAMWATILAGEVWQGELINRRKDGSLYTEEQTITPLRDAGGAISHFIGIKQDVSERKQAEALIRARLAELEVVSRVSSALRAAQSSEEMLPILLDETLAAIESEAGGIWLAQPGAEGLHVAVARGWFAQLAGLTLMPGAGIVGAAFRSGQTHRSDEIAGGLALPPAQAAQLPGGWGGICLPLRTATEIVGVLAVALPRPHPITREQSRLLDSLAEMAGTALHRSRLHEETQRRLEHLQALQVVDRAITASLATPITLDILLEQVTTQLRVDAAGVLLYHPGTHTLRYAAGRGFRDQAYQRSSMRLGEGTAGRAALERRMIQTALPLDSADVVRAALLDSERFVAYIAVPFVAKGQIKGVLEVFHRWPLRPDAEWLDFLATLAGQAAVAIDNIQLFENLQQANLEITLAYDATIEGWSRALDLRDRETEGHTRRVTDMTLRLARAAGIAEEELTQVRRGALLHDIGKMGIPDAILLKPAALTEAEWAVMHKHPTYAYELLAPIAYLRPALDIPYCHHEQWDGSGYPRGLRGDAIPLVARLFAVVDVWDALRSDRPYRRGWPEAQVLAHIQAQAGTHFDPRVVELFLQMIGQPGA